jgi:hypothetical protein
MTIARRTLLQLSLLGAAGRLALPPSPIEAAEDKRTRWIFLGSKGGPRITTGRSNPANVLLIDNEPYIVDCGAGISKRLAEANNRCRTSAMSSLPICIRTMCSNTAI